VASTQLRDGSSKLVQPFDPGAVKTIHVQNGFYCESNQCVNEVTGGRVQ
jgi:hypothetical protein